MDAGSKRLLSKVASLSLGALDRAAVAGFRITNCVVKVRDWLREVVASFTRVLVVIEAHSEPHAQAQLAHLRTSPGFVSAEIEKSEDGWKIIAWIDTAKTLKA